MEVRATAQGYYDLKIRNEGDVFTIKSKEDFSDLWMDKVEHESKPQAKLLTRKSPPSEVHAKVMEKSMDGAKDSKGSVI